MKNEYKTKGDVTEIYIVRLNGEKFTCLIDTEDLPKLIKRGRKWSVDLPVNDKYGRYKSRLPYAVSSEVLECGKIIYPKMHRLLTNAKEGEVVDHINGNTLDNRKCNLRRVTNFENQQNRRGANVNSATGLRNINYCKERKTWNVQIMINGKRFRKRYKDLEEAKHKTHEIRERGYV